MLIDHPVVTMGWVKSIPFEEMKRNAVTLAQAARFLRALFTKKIAYRVDNASILEGVGV